MFWAPRGWHQRSALNPPIQHVLAPKPKHPTALSNLHNTGWHASQRRLAHTKLQIYGSPTRSIFASETGRAADQIPVQGAEHSLRAVH